MNPRARKLKPYFPGYLFVFLDNTGHIEPNLQWIPGGLGLVMYGGEVPIVPPNLIAAVRHRLDEIEKTGAEIFTTLKSGDHVIVHEGPFRGYEALFDTRINGTDRVQVLLKILKGQLLKVELPSKSISKKRN